MWKMTALKSDEEILKEVDEFIINLEGYRIQGQEFFSESSIRKELRKFKNKVKDDVKKVIALTRQECEKDDKELENIQERINQGFYKAGQKAERENSDKEISEFKERILEMIKNA